MSGKRRKKYKKIDDYMHYLGDYVAVYFKQTQILDVDPNGEPVIGNGVKGYVLDITEHSILLGLEPDTLLGTIDIEDIGFIRFEDNIPNALKFPAPPEGEQH